MEIRPADPSPRIDRDRGPPRGAIPPPTRTLLRLAELAGTPRTAPRGYVDQGPVQTIVGAPPIADRNRGYQVPKGVLFGVISVEICESDIPRCGILLSFRHHQNSELRLSTTIASLCKRV
jgi:hypothetical protein